MLAIKTEDLNISESKANEMLEAFRDILLEIGYSPERIENIPCRSMSGFIPYSHNKGGLRAFCYALNSHLSGSGYDYGDDIIQKWNEFQHKSYSEDHRLIFRFLTQFWDGKREDSKLVQSALEHYQQYIDGDWDYDSTCFEVRLMVLQDGSVDVDVFGSTMDAPYFRTSDYNEHKNFKFVDAESFKSEVLEFLNGDEVVSLIRECY
jgi:hypothetical protein